MIARLLDLVLYLVTLAIVVCLVSGMLWAVDQVAEVFDRGDYIPDWALAPGVAVFQTVSEIVRHFA